MPPRGQINRNWAVWLVSARLAILCNVVLFANLPEQRAIPGRSATVALSDPGIRRARLHKLRKSTRQPVCNPPRGTARPWALGSPGNNLRLSIR